MATRENRRAAGRGLRLAGLFLVCYQGLSWLMASSTAGAPAPLALVMAAAEVVDDAAPEEGPSIVTKVVGAAAQGLVAACVAALLSAFTEPIVNRLLVERCTVAQAIGAVKVKDCLKFFLTTFPTNMMKFPIFEVINTILSFAPIPTSFKGMAGGFLFCSIMLPVTNYRFRKSMNMPIEPALLYQAYPPTVIRDIAYGWSRTFFGALINSHFLTKESGALAKAFAFGVTVWIACIVSSPGNEWRGFWLQPPAKKLPFNEFFKLERYLRSTGVGATIMGISLMVGMLLVPYAEALWEQVKDYKAYMAVGLVLAAFVLPRLCKSK